MASQDPSAALASLIAILSQTHPQTPSHPLPPPPQPTSLNPSNPSATTSQGQHVLDYAHVEAVFPEGDILDTTPWIGVQTTQWYSPYEWSLSRPVAPQHPPLMSRGQLQQPHHHQSNYHSPSSHSPSSLVPQTYTLHRPISPPAKRKRSASPDNTSLIPQKSMTSVASEGTSYAHALKYVVQKSQDEEFIRQLRDLKRRQDEFEKDLWDERERIGRKFQGKRTMDKVLESLGSVSQGEKVLGELEEKELKEFDEGVWKRWEEYITEQKREMDELGVPYMTIPTEKTTETFTRDEENRKKILVFIQDIITELPSYFTQPQ